MQHVKNAITVHWPMITAFTINNKNIALGGIIKPIKNNTMSRLNLKRVGNTDLTYAQALDLMEDGKLVSQKAPFSKGVFAFKIHDLEAPVSVMVNNSGLPNQVKDYYKAKYPNPTSENNPIIKAKGGIVVKLEEDELVLLNHAESNQVDESPWFEVEPCFAEDSDFVITTEPNKKTKKR